MRLTLFFAYITQGYISLIGILLMPFFLNLLGTEAFGLIGFFLMLQVWLQLLDLGMSPTLSREMSLYRAGTINSATAWQRLRSLEWLLGSFAIPAATALIVWRHMIASDWLSFKHLSSDDVATCITLMTITAVLRWLMGLYRSGLIGMEQQLWVNGMSAIFVTLKFIGVLPWLIYLSTSPLVFFTYQVVIGILELLVFMWVMYNKLPGFPTSPFPVWSELRGMFPIAGALAFMAGMWIIITQIDKLILSKLLSLEAYGYFTLAVMLAGGLLMLTIPLTQVLQPRMTILASQGKEDALLKLYRQATQLLTAVFIALGTTLALFAEPVLFAWTGSHETAQITAPILFWYGPANALIGILIMPFMLQFAYGYLRLHVIGNLLLLIILLPILIYSSIKHGGAGAGLTLLTVRFLFLFLWVPLVHQRLLPDIIWRWPLFDIGKVAFPIIIFLVVAHELLPQMDNRMSTVFAIGFIFLCSLLVGLLAGDRSRKNLMHLIENRI